MICIHKSVNELSSYESSLSDDLLKEKSIGVFPSVASFDSTTVVNVSLMIVLSDSANAPTIIQAVFVQSSQFRHYHIDFSLLCL